jgi:hypothetical protein
MVDASDEIETRTPEQRSGMLIIKMKISFVMWRKLKLIYLYSETRPMTESSKLGLRISQYLFIYLIVVYLTTIYSK